MRSGMMGRSLDLSQLCFNMATRIIVFALFFTKVICSDFVVLAPNELGWDTEENVAVSGVGNNRVTVEVYLQDYPDRINTFSKKAKTVQAGKWETVTVEANPANFPDTDRLQLSRVRYVYLVAKSGNVVKESVLLMTEKVANVYVQTDKPLYSPGQTMIVSIFATDGQNNPLRIPVRLELVSPEGVSVLRKEGSTEFHNDLTSSKLNGFHKESMPLAKYIKHGNWSVVVSYGPMRKGQQQFTYNTSVTVEITEYVLPTFSCKLTSLPEYIYKAGNGLLTGTVNAEYTFKQPVQGKATIRIGYINNGVITYVFTMNNNIFVNGKYDFEVDLKEKIYNRNRNFNFDTMLKGKRLVVNALCYEAATGTYMEDINSQAIFVTEPFIFNFDKTVRYFKPGLPFIYQFQVLYNNGKVASGIPITISAKGVKKNKGQINLEINGDRQIFNTNQNGLVKAIYSGTSQLEKVIVTFVAQANDGGNKVTHRGTNTLHKSDSANDIIIKYDNENKVGEMMSFEIIKKGGTYSELNWLVISRGRIVESKKSVKQHGQLEFINVRATPDMIPSARLLVYFVQGNKMGGDSLWLDISGSCTDGFNVKTVSNNNGNYQLKGDGSTYASFEVTGLLNSYVVLQMVDQAVLVLNDRTHLTPNKMVNHLEELDLGCGSGDGKSISEVLRNSGLAASTSLVQTSNSQQVNTVARPCHVTRKRRSVLEEDMTMEQCCEHGSDVTASNCQDELLEFTMQFVPNLECSQKFMQCCKRHLGIQETDDSDRDRSRQGDDSNDVYLEQFNVAQIRRNFPESVFIGVVEMGANNQKQIRLKLPDSISSWSVQAVQMNQVNGICVAEPHNFVVDKQLFLKVKLPYTAVRGEHLLAEVTVHNYHGVTIAAYVQMRGTPGVCSDTDGGELSRRRRVNVRAKHAVSLRWKLVPLELGDFFLTFGLSHGGELKDAEERKLTVIPEGIPVIDPTSFQINPSKKIYPRNNPTCTATGNINGVSCTLNSEVLPPSYVVGSAEARITFTGNSFGPAYDIIMTGLDAQLKMPRGCGEQVMIRVAPAVYAYDYMLQTGTTTKQIEGRTAQIVKDGVIRLLPFRHQNGGIAVWHKKTPYIWLTSLILKVFAKANENGHKVDSNFLSGAVRFIFDSQVQAGPKRGRFDANKVANHHHEMIGALSHRDLTLTAVVLSSLFEANIEPERYEPRLQMTCKYLGQNLGSVQSAYEAALVAYALSLSNHPSRNAAYTKLKTYAREEHDLDLKMRYFPGKPGNSKKILVETAAYAILTSLQHDDLEYCDSIVVWLHKQRINGGIFQTTQDTMISLQALSAYAVKLQSANQDTDLTVKVTGLGYRGKNIHIEHINQESMNREVTVPIHPGVIVSNKKITIDVQGSGSAQFTFQYGYNVVGKPNCSFNLSITKDVEVQDGHTKSFLLNTCAKFLYGDRTDMAMVEIDLLTGFRPQDDSLAELKKDGVIDSFEVTDKSLALYLPNITSSNHTCLPINMTREMNVSSVSPGVVKVYDYYNREHECSKIYGIDDSWQLQHDGEKCYEGTCAKNHSLNPWDFEAFLQDLCTPRVVYVLRADYVETITHGDWNYHKAVVKFAMKKGKFDLIKGSEVYLAYHVRCNFLQFKTGGSYFIMGLHEDQVELPSKKKVIRLTMDNYAYVEQWKARKGNLTPHQKLRMHLRRNTCKE